MRKIESAIVKALKTSYPYQQSIRDRTISLDSGEIAYTLWSTVIFTYSPSKNTLTLRPIRPEHRTPTTKSRINAILSGFDQPDCIYQKAGVWYFRYFWHTFHDVPYEGVTIEFPL